MVREVCCEDKLADHQPQHICALLDAVITLQPQSSALHDHAATHCIHLRAPHVPTSFDVARRSGRMPIAVLVRSKAQIAGARLGLSGPSS